MRRVPRWLLGLAAASAVCAVSATPAWAAAPKKKNPYAVFAQCPTSVPNLTLCVYSDTTSGTFKIGSQTVPITAPIVFQGGIAGSGSGDVFYGAANGDTLSPTPLPVPGGLLGLTPPNLFPAPLQGIVNAAINSFNGVTATATLVGNPSFSYQNFITGAGPTVSLPVEIQLSNPFLGNACYIGSSSDPVTLNLTTGTTSPPSGTAPLTGTHGKLQFKNQGNLVIATGDSLVDNTFAVPGATGCGGALAPIVDPIVDLKTGIPAAAGVSQAILNGNSDLASASAVIASQG